jgi:hypothetical protein
VRPGGAPVIGLECHAPRNMAVLISSNLSLVSPELF